MSDTAYAVKRIILEMKALYGNMFDRQWQGWETEELVGSWVSHLEGYSRDELARGFNALKSLKYAPTLAEFMQLCRPPIDPLKAYYEAVKGTQERRNGNKGTWTHPAIFWASASMAHDLLNMSYQQIKPHWEKKLAEEMEKTTWQEIPEVAKTLPAPPVNAETKEQYAQALKQYGAERTVKQDARGNGQWILNNIERMKKGWKPVPAVRNCIMAGARALGIQIPEGI